MSDVRDIMGIGVDSTSPRRPKAAAKRSETSKRGPTEVKKKRRRSDRVVAERELLALAGPLPSVTATVKVDLPAKKDSEPLPEVKRAQKWVWRSFMNSARNDAVELHHWAKEDEDPGREYGFAVFNKKVPVLRYSDAEFEKFFSDNPSWNRKSTDLLLEAAEKFDRRFVVMHDWLHEQLEASRAAHDCREEAEWAPNVAPSTGGGPRDGNARGGRRSGLPNFVSVEDVKDWFFFIQRTLLKERDVAIGGKAEGSAVEEGKSVVGSEDVDSSFSFILRHPYNKESEIARKKRLEAWFSRTPEGAAADDLLTSQAEQLKLKFAKTLDAPRVLDIERGKHGSLVSKHSIAPFTAPQKLLEKVHKALKGLGIDPEPDPSCKPALLEAHTRLCHKIAAVVRLMSQLAPLDHMIAVHRQQLKLWKERESPAEGECDAASCVGKRSRVEDGETHPAKRLKRESKS